MCLKLRNLHKHASTQECCHAHFWSSDRQGGITTVAKEYSNQHPNASDERHKQTIDETTRAATDNARTTTNAHTHTRTRIRFVRVLVVGVEVESKSRGIVGNQTNNGRGGGSGTTGSERKRQSASNQQGSGNQPPINKPTQSYSMRLDVP